MQEKQPRFIVVDDDSLNNLLCKKLIAQALPNADVKTFTEPETGLEYIISNFSKPNVGKAILLLDINMPTMTGWEFMEQLQKVSSKIKQRIFIYILSSSINPLDKEKAKNNPNIIDCMEKPLTRDIIESLS